MSVISTEKKIETLSHVSKAGFNLIVYMKMALNFGYSCRNLLSAGVADMSHTSTSDVASRLCCLWLGVAGTACLTIQE